MRPTFVHLIAGLGLGTALTVSLALPGRFVLGGQPHVHGLALPRSGGHVVVVEAAPVAQPAPERQVEPRRSSVPRSSQGRQPHAVRESYPQRSRPRLHSQRPQVAHRTPPVPRPAPSAPQRLQPLAAPSGTATEDEDEKVKKPKRVKKIKASKQVEAPKKAKKVKEEEKDKAKPDKDGSKGEQQDKAKTRASPRATRRTSAATSAGTARAGTNRMPPCRAFAACSSAGWAPSGSS